MTELLLVAYLIAFFNFPITILSFSLAVATCLILKRRYHLQKNQPPFGKEILGFYLNMDTFNLVISVFFGITIAFFVYFLITKNPYTFILNIIFVGAIAFRWLDFSNSWFRSIYNKKFANITPVNKNSNFVVIYGLKPGNLFGFIPNQLDIGYINRKSNFLEFKGAFSHHIFKPSNFARVEKLSSEKILLWPTERNSKMNSEILMIKFRDQFCPHKSKTQRDLLFALLTETPFGDTIQETKHLAPQPFATPSVELHHS